MEKGYIQVYTGNGNCFICNSPEEEDIRLAREGLKECEGILASGKYDIVVLDEINIITQRVWWQEQELKNRGSIICRV